MNEINIDTAHVINALQGQINELMGKVIYLSAMVEHLKAELAKNKEPPNEDH